MAHSAVSLAKSKVKANTMQKYFTLFASFFKIGLFTFGGGYAMISIIQTEVISRRRWIEEKEF